LLAAQAPPGAGDGSRPGQVRIVSADDSLAMDEGALASLRRPRSSAAIACQLVRRGQAQAVVSAGSTGGTVATARLRLRALPGVLRPGLVVVLPTRPTPRCRDAYRGTRSRRCWSPSPSSGWSMRRSGTASLSLGSACSRSAPSRQGKPAGPPRPRTVGPCTAARRPADRFIGNVEGGDLLTRKADDRDRRFHRQRRAEGGGGDGGLAAEQRGSR
jgi:glycerol-3-phosphate acyltransferase PlsX